MLEKIKALLAEELGVNAEEITAETSFKEDLGADSLDLFELVTNLEEEYNIEIPAEQLEEMTTVGKVIDYLKSIHIEA
ncbi:acyl carrier protein [Pseudocoprococcus immobilis]|uniref:acyl carrier protein n=1 Tax=Coprococcus catus TaxID=116085 RepID=UPI001C01CE1A|nr:acyl carrier protein [Coprococcus catus]MBT9769081.1 acyl carrier protein [Coprococcus catus]